MRIRPSRKKDDYKLTEVVSTVSHQLKTPLSAIKGYIEVLLSGDLGNLTKEQKEYLRDMLENTKQMIALVTDLLEVTRIEADKIELRPKDTDLVELLKETLEEFSFLARAKNCTLSMEVVNEIPILKVDPVKIKEVMANLISNAINYNERKGEVKVYLEKKGNKVIFACEDTGIGITEEEKDKIFSKFYRSERAVSLVTSGSGLGLFISKAIIEKSGGKIWFESEPEEKTVFYFSLPVK